MVFERKGEIIRGGQSELYSRESFRRFKGNRDNAGGGQNEGFSGKIRGNADRERQNEHFKGKI